MNYVFQWPNVQIKWYGDKIILHFMLRLKRCKYTYIFYLYILVPSIYVYVEAVPNEKFFMNFIEFLRWFAR